MGLVAGLALLVIGVTGSLLVFAKELETVFNPAFMRVEQVQEKRLSMDLLLTSANRELPEYEVAGWLIRHDDPGLADVLYMIRHGTDEWRVGTLDPYTGKILATPREYTATLTGWLLELHYKFFADHAGMMATAVLAVLLCGLGVTGLWLYRDFWRNFVRLRWRASGRIFFSDLHKTVGISSVAFNLVLGFTGAYWNFTHVIGEWINGEHQQPKVVNRMYGDSISLENIIAEGERRIPGFRANFLSLPNEPGAPITLWGKVQSSNPLRGTYGSTVVFDAQSGAFKQANDVRKAGLWAQFVDMFEPVHYGNFGGWPVKILWCAGGLTPGVLAVSGFMIWWKRGRKRGIKEPGELDTQSVTLRRRTVRNAGVEVQSLSAAEEKRSERSFSE
jgi:uncharacterized iron-regulated membrane protein